MIKSIYNFKKAGDSVNIIKTKPNIMSLIIIASFILLGIGGIVYFFFIDILEAQIFVMIISILLIILGSVISLGTFTNYEVVIDDKLIIHRFFKIKAFLIMELSCIEFHGAYIKIMDSENNEVCRIMTNKANLIPLLEVLESKGLFILDFSDKSDNNV